MNRKLAGRGAIVTGGLGGIGYAIAKALAREGAAVMLLDLREDTGGRCIEELLRLGARGAAAIALSVTEEGALAGAVAETITRFGGFDLLANVAGKMIYKPLTEIGADEWRDLLDVNLVGAAVLTGMALDRMRDGGAIVNVASVHARQTSPLVAPYAAAKAALESLTRSAAIEGAARGIRANALLPGAVDTPMLRASPNIASGTEVLAPEDVGTPDEVAAAALFLLSPEARFVTGASLLVDGGRLAKL